MRSATASSITFNGEIFNYAEIRTDWRTLATFLPQQTPTPK
jgi:asparagine synthetase B (glutamine-hydrolysing)